MFQLVYENRAKGAYKTIVYDGLKSVLETYDFALTLDAKKDELNIYYVDRDLIAHGKLRAVMQRQKDDICAIIEISNGVFAGMFDNDIVLSKTLDGLHDKLNSKGYSNTLYSF